MMNVYVSIGNSDDKLSQRRWHEFWAATRETIARHASHVHGEWLSIGVAPYQNACICFEIDDVAATALKQELQSVTCDFGQDSIAWAEARMEFLGPRRFPLNTGAPCEPDGDEEPRCPECHIPLTMHHEPGCGMPCRQCAQAKAHAALDAQSAAGHGEPGTNPVDEWHVSLLERAWGIIANAGWDECAKSPGWQEAAIRWRDHYHQWLTAHLSPSGYQSWEQLAESLRRERDELSFQVRELTRATTDKGLACEAGRYAGRLVIQLPDAMAGEHYKQIARLGKDWSEILPGLQATADITGTIRKPEIIAAFRITPVGETR